MSEERRSDRSSYLLVSTLLLSGALMLVAACASTQSLSTAEQLSCLLAGVRSSDRVRQEASIEDLGKIGAPAAAAVPVLASLLARSRDDVELSRAILISLERIGPTAAPALPAILRALIANAELEEAVADTVRALRAEGERQALEVLNNDSDWRVRRLAAEMLADSPVVVGEVNEVLIRAVADERHALVRQAILRTLGQRGVAGALPVLVRALNSDEWQVAVQASQSLTKMGAVGAAALEAALHGSNRAASLAVAEVMPANLAKSRSKDARAALLSKWRLALTDQQDVLRVAALRAIAKLGRDAVSAARTELSRLLTDPSSDVQEAAEETLALLDEPL
ncbi:MAG: HEAT repeat domain-containing protein [Deltaproteobacteria bacterium]|nr:HEAT repeat domain-containing protein [Deltaproteobacteria bacterium]